MNSEERDMLRRFAEDQDQAAFGELVHRHIGLVYHSALRRTGDAHASEDITQRVFLLLAKKAGKVSDHETITGWLYTTTRLETHQFLRLERRRVAREREAAMAHEIEGTEPLRAWEKLRPVIDAALDKLDAVDRDAVLLRFFANQPFAAIGQQLNVTENAARMRVERALDKLNGILSTHKITSLSLAAAFATETVAASAPPALAAQVTAHAITGAAMNGGTAVFLTMTTSKIIVGTAATLVALGLGTAWYETSASRQTLAELESVKHRLEESRTQLTMTQQQLKVDRAASKTDNERIGTLEKELARAKLAQPIPATAASPSARPTKRWSNAEYAKLQLENFRLTLRGKFQPLYDALHLTKNQVAAVEAIEMEWKQDIFDIWAAAETSGLDTANTAVARLTSDPMALKLNKLKALLGEDGLKQYTDFDSPKTGRALTVIGNIAGELYASETPLSPAQGSQLRQTIMDHTEIVKEPMASDGKKQMYRLVPQTDWAAVNAKSAAFLSEGQRAVLQNQADLEVINQKMMQR